jgi:hypothetical protein
MHKDSKKYLLGGLGLSLCCWGILLPVAGTEKLTPIYTVVIIGAFVGIMLAFFGIINFGMSKFNKE